MKIFSDSPYGVASMSSKDSLTYFTSTLVQLIYENNKLKEYLRKFHADYIIKKIRELIDFDFYSKPNPKGYFYKY